MKINHGLFRNVLLMIGGVLLILVLGYSLLARSLYFMGLDNSYAYMAADVQRVISKQGFAAVQGKLDFIHIYHRYQDLPEPVRKVFSESDLELGEHYSMSTRSYWYEPPEVIYLIHPAVGQDAKNYYLVNEFDVTDLVPEIERLEEQVPSIWVVSGVIIIILSSLGILLAQYIARPIKRLNQWAQSLDLNTLAKPVPSFGFSELNQLAQKIHNNLQGIEQALTRESQFLQHASHELRTPISVILSNASLMEHLWHAAPEESKQPLERIIRAGLTMSHLTETLLWLTRNNEYQPTVEAFSLDLLIQELVEEHQYLLAGKPVTMKLDLAAICRQLPKVLVRIILANLIRNAMQHTDSGEIVIRLTQEQLTIRNRGALLMGEKNDGFGLGIKLVQRICNNQGWHYSQHTTSDTSTAVLVM